ncbi:MAG: hypothetical protein AAFX01_13035 [Cyanobacteria bacterium J06638_28]
MNSYLQFNRQWQKALTQRAIKGLLAVTLGLMAVSCAKGVTSPPQPGTSEEATKPENALVAGNTSPENATAEQTSANANTLYAEVGNDGEPDEPLTANIERLELQPGTPYGDVRSLVMAEGWMPYTQAEGATSDPNNPTVQRLYALGFEEADTCSGTGQGFCSFLFIHINQAAFPDARLQIITTPASGDLDAEPNFYSWDMWDYEPVVSNAPKGDSPNYQYLEANATYDTQKFNAALYAEVLAQEQDCVLIGDCAYSKYLFEDVLLTFSTGEFGSTTMAVIPHANVSRNQALNYAQMLDLDDEIDFTDSILVDNYEGGELPPEGIKVTESFFAIVPPAEGDASTRMVRIITRPNEDISRIEFEIVML